MVALSSNHSHDASNKGDRKMFALEVQFFTPENGAVIKVIDFVENLNDSAEGRVKTIPSSQPLVMFLHSVPIMQMLIMRVSEILRGSCHTYIVHNTLKKSPRQPFS